MLKNCPNCGGVLTFGQGVYCEYCGTVIEPAPESLSLALGRTVTLKFEHGGYSFEFDLEIENVTLDSGEAIQLYTDGIVWKTVCDPDYRACFSGRIVNTGRAGR